MHKNITIFTSSMFEMNSIVIELPNSVIAIDLGITHNELEKIKNFIENKDKKNIFHLITHADFDHVGGISLFSKQFIIGSKHHSHKSSYQIQEKEWIDFHKLHPENILKPFAINYDYEVNIKKSFDIDGIDLEVFSTPGHTKDSVTILIQSLGVMVIGDMLSSCDIPIVNDSKLNYIKSLNTIYSYYNKYHCILIPGHGSLIMTEDDLLKRMHRDLYYLTELLDEDVKTVKEWLEGEGLLSEDNINYHKLNSQRK